jgi:ATP-dependent exoDNAse (exonuclease V) beta subunit
VKPLATPPTVLDRIARFERDLVVQAGAGTGKTHALVTLYLHLVAGLTAARRRTPVARIAVVTFTDKAAGELKERLRARLSAAAERRARSEPTLAAAARALGLPLPDGELWLQAVAQLGAAPVGTFHSFAGALLGRHAAAAGVDPDFTLLDEGAATDLAVEAAERAVLDGLDRGEPEVVALVGEYGYHSVGRADRLVEHLIALRAARAEEGRGPDGLERGHDPATLDAAWRAAWAAVMRGFGALSSTVPELTGKSAERARDLCAAAERLTCARASLRAVDELVRGLNILRGARGVLQEVKDQIRDAAERLVEAEAGYHAAPLAVTLARLVAITEHGYQAAKRRAGALDFTDLLVLARNLVRDDPRVRATTQARFDAVLVDEFQDTNPVQAELVELVAGPPGASGRRFVVGDRKQSIYEFRGADVGVFTEVARGLVERGGQEELLRQSRRSAPSLLAFTNALFARAMASPLGRPAWALSFELGRDDLEPVRPEPSNGGVELLTVAPGDAAAARAREARAIAARIAQLRAGGRGYGEMAILLRRFTALGDYLEALRAAQIPHYVVRGRGLYAAQEVRDLASALTLLDDPDDALALVAVLRSPIVGISDETLARLSLERKLRPRTT